MDTLQLKEFLAEALTESVADRRARLKLSDEYAKLDDRHKQLVEAWFGIFRDLFSKAVSGHPMNIEREMRNEIARRDDQYEQLLDGLRNICEEIGMKPAASCGPKDFVKRIRAELYQIEELKRERNRCPECGFELVSSSTGCADEPDECLVCSLRDDIKELEQKGLARDSRVEILVRALKAAGIEPGLKCAEFKTDAGSILLGVNSDGKTFDVEWTPDGITPPLPEAQEESND